MSRDTLSSVKDAFIYMNLRILNHIMKEGEEVCSYQLTTDLDDHHGLTVVNTGYETVIISSPHRHIG